MLRIFPLNAEAAPPFLEPYLLTYSKKLLKFLSEIEAEILTGEKVTTINSDKISSQKLLKIGVKTVVMKLRKILFLPLIRGY